MEMSSLKVQGLSAQAFLPFGYYAHLIDPKTERIGAPPVEFFRDMVQQDLGTATIASYSVCRVEHREPAIDVTEYHNHAAEGILPLDNDVLIHVGPATPPGEPPPLARFQAFRVPRGTMVVLRPGVWHHAPLTANREAANVLIVLPERTYANDCVVVELEESQRIRVVE
jgi:ureidoglycolate lyase